MAPVLARFSAATSAWFQDTFAAPTAAQEQGWAAIAQSEHTLILAPTGSGKTLAAFLWCLDRLATQPVPTDPKQRCRVLYVSRLKALAHDVERNLKAPLVGIGLAATQRPLDEIGRFLGGVDRPVTLVDVGKRKRLDLQVVVPLEDMDNPGTGVPEPPPGGSVLGADLRAEARNSVWPSIYPRL